MCNYQTCVAKCNSDIEAYLICIDVAYGICDNILKYKWVPSTFTIMRRRRLHKACAKEILNQRKKESIEQYIGFYTIK